MKRVEAQTLFDLTDDEWYEAITGFEEKVCVSKDTGVLYFDGDGGAAVFSWSEMFEADGFAMELVDCQYVEIQTQAMLTVVTMVDAIVKGKALEAEELG